MKIDEAAKRRIHELRAEGKTLTLIAAEVGCSITSLHRILRPSYRAIHCKSSVNSRARVKQEIQAVKLEAGCADCGYNAHPAALDFDHLPGTVKCFNIGPDGPSHSWHDVLLEIAKCDVVCANCHRIRSATRGWMNQFSN
jgi:hypothetical protein